MPCHVGVKSTVWVVISFPCLMVCTEYNLLLRGCQGATRPRIPAARTPSFPHPETPAQPSPYRWSPYG